MKAPKSTERPPLKATGEVYESVAELMKCEEVSNDVVSKVSKARRDSIVTTQLAKMRQGSGITQKEMASKLGVTQSTISKLESGLDETITLANIRDYAKATGVRLSITIGKRIPHIEAVNNAARDIKHHLSALATIANQHDELQPAIEKCVSEAVMNILGVIAKCSSELPRNGSTETEFRIKAQLAGFEQGTKRAPSESLTREEIAA